MKYLRYWAWSLAVVLLLGGLAERVEAQLPYGPTAAPMMAPGMGMPGPGQMAQPYPPQGYPQYAPAGMVPAAYAAQLAPVQSSGVTMSLSSDEDQAAGSLRPLRQFGNGAFLHRMQAAMPRLVPEGMERHPWPERAGRG